MLVVEEHALPVISCLVWYKVGARNERSGTTGLSHLVEHLLFQNVGNFRKGEFGATIVRNGGQFNGFTSDDFTAFFETIHPSKLELALRMEAERMRSTKLTAADVKAEIETISREFDREARDPQSLLAQEVRSSSFQNHPYRNPTMGWRADVANLTVEDARAFYEKFYGPGNATLIVVGDCKAPAVFALAKRYFGPLSKTVGSPPPMRAVEATQKVERRVMMRYAGKRDVLMLSYHAPSLGDPDSAAMVVLEKLLNSTYAGRLKTRLVDTKQCTSASSTFELKKDPGLFTLTVTAPSGTGLEKVLGSVDGMLNQLRLQLVSDSELRRARNEAEFACFSERDGAYRTGFHLGYFDCLQNWQAAYTWPDRLRTVNANDLQRLVRTHLVPENRVVGWLGSTSTAPTPKQNNKTSPGSPPKKPAPSAEYNRVVPKTPLSFRFEHVQTLVGYKRDDSSASPANRAIALKTSSRTDKTVSTNGSAKSSAKSSANASARSDKGSAKSSAKDGAGKSKESKEGAGKASGSAPEKAAAGAKSGSTRSGSSGGTSTQSKAGTTRPPATSTSKGATSTTNGRAGAMNGSGGKFGVGPATASGVIPPSVAGFCTHRRLQSGMNVIVLESRLSPIVQVCGAISARENSEPSNKRAVSALTGQVLNNGNSRQSRAQLAVVQEELGLPPGAMVKFEATPERIGFQTRCLARDLYTQLSTVALAVKEPALQDADLERAKQDFFNSLKQTEELTSTKVDRALLRNLLAPGSPSYPIDPSDRVKSVTGLKTSDVRDFMSRCVTPAATTIVIVGDVDAEAVFQMVDKAFSGWTSVRDNQAEASVSPPVVPAVRRMLKSSIPLRETDDTMICLGKLVKMEASASEYSQLMMADCALTNHPIFSRIVQRLDNETVLATSLSPEEIQSRFQQLPGTVCWSLTLPAHPNTMTGTVNAIHTELRKFVKVGVTNQELNELKRFMIGALPVRSMQNTTLAARSILDFYLRFGVPDLVPECSANWRTLTADNLNKFIRNVFKPDMSSLIVAGDKQSIRKVKPQDTAEPERESDKDSARQSSSQKDARASLQDETN